MRILKRHEVEDRSLIVGTFAGLNLHDHVHLGGL